MKNLPVGHPKSAPQIQAPRSSFRHPSTTDPRRQEVLRVFKRSYAAYSQHAWMRDELTPVTGAGKDTFGGWAATLVDTLDTLWIMGLKTEFYEATNAIVGMDFSTTPDGAGAVNLFETTIRHLGGLLGAYDLSGERALLLKAVELGEMLYKAFDTPNRLPGFWLNFEEVRKGIQIAGTNDPSACPASLSLEFTRLSQITGDPKFYDAADRVTRFLEDVQDKTKLPGMWPVTLNFREQQAPGDTFSLGALADSLYEYLPKMHLLLGGLDDTYEKLYRASMQQVVKHLLYRPMLPDNADILFLGDVHIPWNEVQRVPEGQHLTCFAGGMFGLGGKLFDIDAHIDIGERLARGCGWAYGQFPTGVMPEIFNLIPCDTIEGCTWDEDKWLKQGDQTLNRGWMNARDPRYILRPEAIESIFLLYRMTGKEDLRDLAWDMFQGIVRSTETSLAYSAIRDVTAIDTTEKEDCMESFWLAETLKYFYLIFSPVDLISLDDYVLNTEAHPFRRPK
ncbi:mannosyl-oligosaccharide alpha-1 [Emericellopsis cladophorae]|uniref:alpha-1,2-Mannosidase n=1 Tax=Emericellopsis cladophorae TaxID=2686198 RepID=A0A9P9Y2F8_9HYPO|nr:mannosyl-oligosaccharide alpha-1 [Emericellopsis cladophorae]KAI6781860.1 mannosyl-oligosaccharide alpha-1 [Emericellopsis cladophorae]